MTVTEAPTIALLGTGTMGLPIGRNLLAAGLPLRVWNRNADKAEPLAEHGAVLAGSPGDAVSGADVLITMLYDADSVVEVMRQAAGRFAPSATWLQMTTVGVEGADRLAELAEEFSLIYVDAPVLGTKQPAEKGELVVLAAGPADIRPTCQPIFDVIGGRTIWLDRPGDASKLKLVANAWVVAVLEGIAQSLALAEGLGLDPALFLEAVRGGAMDAPYVQLKGNSMLTGDFAPSFGLSNADKDVQLILRAAERAGVQLPTVRAAHEYFSRAIEAGHGAEDMAAVFLVHRPS
jgi:3-hydroxyisobutyrate dehydrogenase